MSHWEFCRLSNMECCAVYRPNNIMLYSDLTFSYSRLRSWMTNPSLLHNILSFFVSTQCCTILHIRWKVGPRCHSLEFYDFSSENWGDLSSTHCTSSWTLSFDYLSIHYLWYFSLLVYCFSWVWPVLMFTLYYWSHIQTSLIGIIKKHVTHTSISSALLQLLHAPHANQDLDQTQCDTQSAPISSSVHDLSPTLWHALDVWRCATHLGAGLQDALRALAHCGMGLAAENWWACHCLQPFRSVDVISGRELSHFTMSDNSKQVLGCLLYCIASVCNRADGLCAMQVLADVARVKLSVLKVLQNLARGIAPRPHTPETQTGDAHCCSLPSGSNV